jgi:two-component system, LytTR family, sensor kinase
VWSTNGKAIARASAFVAALAASYRYLLTTGSRRLVPLSDELALLDQFLSLVTIRYADGLKMSVQVDETAAARWRIPPGVLPELLENAVKHNEVSADNPLEIAIRLEGIGWPFPMTRGPARRGWPRQAWGSRT